MPYSLDLRQKVINFVENGRILTEVAHIFGIGRASYIDGYLTQNWKQLR